MTPVCLEDYTRLAEARLPAPVAAYLFGGSADEITLGANRAAFNALSLTPRVMRDLRGGETAITLFGAPAAPLLVAPMGFQRLFHPAGEIATAQAAAAMGAGFVLPTLASTTLEAVAAAGEGAPQWFQLYLQPERAATLRLVRRAESAGYRAMVLTVDAPINGIRNREMRAGFALPPDVRAVNLDGERPAAHPADAHPIFDGLLASAPTWEDLAWLRSATALPILVKGILHPDDAAQALNHGADGVIVSNHGGRALDTAPAALAALPRVVQRIGGRVPVLLDGGIRRGTDIVKALAQGATAVLVGRPIAAALAVGGAQGAAHALRILIDEFAVAMALCGCRTPREITPECLYTVVSGRSVF
jgi:4-hydroxymandelate oxidase